MIPSIQRRSLLTLLGGAAAAWPLAARAQQVPAMPVIGFLNNNSPALWASRLRAFHQGLNDTGYAEGRNVAIEYRWADDQYDRVPGMAADLVRRRVTVIAANSTAVTLVAKAATDTIPIVFGIAGDPVTDGLVASLNRPGGNLTGVTTLGVEVAPKLLELLHEAVPATILGLLVDPSDSNNAEPVIRNLQVAARTLGLQLHILDGRSARDFDTVFATLVQLRAGGLVISGGPFFGSRIEQLAALALRHAVPAIYPTRDFALAGGLMGYGGSFTDAIRLVGVYTGRILKGEKPANLPVQQATRVELAINMKTAKALGITFPITLLGRADEVIE